MTSALSSSPLAVTQEPARSGRKVQLVKLSPKHKQVMALLAQGLDRVSIAALVDLEPEYITWLSNDPLCKAYMEEMNQAVAFRMEALFSKSVDVVADTMVHGSAEEKLKAARLQLEATKRLGRAQGREDDAPESDRLEKLSNRLLNLLEERKTGSTYEGTIVDVETVVEDK